MVPASKTGVRSMVSPPVAPSSAMPLSVASVEAVVGPLMAMRKEVS